MSCCGQRRVSLNTGLSPGAAAPAATPAQRAAAPAPRHATPALQVAGESAGRALAFECIAEGPLAIDGQASGRRYHFAGRGSRVCIDRRDWSQMFRVPGLRHVG